MSRRNDGRSRDRLALEVDLARGRREEAGDEPERRRLAAAGRAEQRDELAFGDVEVDAGHRDGRAVVLLDARQPQRRLSHVTAEGPSRGGQPPWGRRREATLRGD